jgi:MoxR-like ATPase
MGKSAIVRSIAKEFSLKLIDHRLSTSAPEDLSGLPHFVNGKASFLPFDTFPTEDTPIPPGHQGWLLFLDEFNSASKAVQAAAYKLILDRMVGQKRLHPKCVIVCAGNLSTDRAIVNPISTAMQSRLVHLTMVLDHTEFMEDVAFAQNWDSRIVAYLSYKKDALYDFRPDHDDKTFCGPRTWEFMNKLIKGRSVLQEDAALYAGTITSGVAVNFITFTEVFERLPKIEQIVKDPENTPLPDESNIRYATIIHLMEHADNDNLDPIATYVGRLTSEFRVLLFRGLMVRKPELKKHPAFRRALVELSRYLHDDQDIAA